MPCFIVSIDVESDWLHKEENRLSSLRGLHFVQEAAIRYGVSLTYLITYECAVREEAVAIIRDFLKSGLCEVGHHLHVWSTPPFENPNPFGVDVGWVDRVQSELPDDLFEGKMKNLHDAIVAHFGVVPTSHRSGRWAVDERTLRWLEKNNYLVDTSVCPNMSYERKAADGLMTKAAFGAADTPYYPDREDVTRNSRSPERRFKVLEVPVTGIRGDFLSAFDFRGVDRFRDFLSFFGYNGTRPLSFRPSYAVSYRAFQRITRRIFERRRFINFMFHSSELAPGTSPYSLRESDWEMIRKKILFVFKSAVDYGAESIKLSEAPGYFGREMDGDGKNQP